MAESPVTMFGIYVQNFSVNIGWGGQGGSMQLKLIEDPDAPVPVVLPKDDDGNPFFGGGVNSPRTGTAVYFKYGALYFGGIFQRWTYNVTATGGKIYDIVIESPSKLMDGVQIILGKYNGATDLFGNQYNNYDYSTNINTFHQTYYDIKNVFNVFGAYENPFYGWNGSYQNFGASQFNTSGIPIDRLLVGMDLLMDINSPNVFGGPIRFGETAGGDAATKYNVNFVDLAQFFVDESIDFSQTRLKGPVKSVNGILGEMGELFQFDYFYSIEHVNKTGLSKLPNGGGQIVGIDNDGVATGNNYADMKIKIVSKRAAPEANKLKSFITAQLAKPTDEKTMLSYNIGKEFGDSTTQKIIWGGRRTRYLKINNVSSQYAIWGKNANNPKGFNVVGTVGQVYGQPSSPRAIYIEGYGWYKATPFEVRMAQGGKQQWEIFKTFECLAEQEPNGYTTLNSPWTGAFDATSNLIQMLAGGNAGNSYDMVLSNINKAPKQWQAAKTAENDKIFSAVSNVASQTYMQEFLLKLPNEVSGAGYNIYFPADDFQELKSWEISSSAFDSSPLTYDINSWDAVGRVGSLVAYQGRGDCDYSSMGTDYNIGANLAAGSIVTKKGSPEQESFFDQTGYFGGAFLCVFKTGTQVKLFDSITTPDFGLTILADYFFGIDIPPEAYIGSGKESLQFQIPPDNLLPKIFGVPQESGRLNYGPWVTLNKASGGFYNPNGKAEVSEDESMRPETYGSYGALYQIGGIIAAVSESDLIESETGQIELAGAPSWNLGDRFDSLGPYVSNMSISVDATSGVKTTYKFNTWTPQFGTMAKYNIDRIQKINNNRFSFAKKKRDEVEQRPFPKIRFEKTDFSELSKAKQSGSDAGFMQMLFANKEVNTNNQSQG